MRAPRLSLFAKLTAIAAVAAALTIAVFSWCVGAVFEETVERHKTRLHPWANWMVQALLKNPSEGDLRRLAKDLNIDMRYEGVAGAFVTDESLPGFDAVAPAREWRRGGRDGGERPSHRRYRRLPEGFSLVRGVVGGGDGDERREVMLRYEDGSHRLLIDWHRGEERLWDVLLPLLGGLVAALVAIWTAAYLLIRWLLLPLRKLRGDMDAVGRGEWRRSEVRRQDEVGQLAAGFNAMQERLRAHIDARERFLIDASHELRSPIARLKMLAEFVEDAQTRGKVAANVGELEALTADILQNARLRSAHSGLVLAPIDLVAWLRDLVAARDAAERERICLEMAAVGEGAADASGVGDAGERSASSDTPVQEFALPAAAAGVGDVVGRERVDSLDTPVQEFALPAAVDVGALGRAVNNVIDNALRYGRRVWVRVGAGGGRVWVVIEDDGIGVADADLGRLFEPFYRADASRARDSGGYGLGLAIVAGVMEAHGGGVAAAHRGGGGLVIRMWLPGG